MSEFQVNQPEICSICGEEKEPEELSDLDGQSVMIELAVRHGKKAGYVLTVRVSAARVSSISDSALYRPTENRIISTVAANRVPTRVSDQRICTA